MTVDQVMEMTPREFDHFSRGQLWRQEQELERTAMLISWLTADRFNPPLTIPQILGREKRRNPHFATLEDILSGEAANPIAQFIHVEEPGQ